MSRRHFRCHARVRLWAFRFVSVHSTEPRAEARTARELPEVAEASEKLCVVAQTGFEPVFGHGRVCAKLSNRFSGRATRKLTQDSNTQESVPLKTVMGEERIKSSHLRPPNRPGATPKTAAGGGRHSLELRLRRDVSRYGKSVRDIARRSTRPTGRSKCGPPSRRRLPRG